MKQLPPIAEMQRAYLASDASYDGVFYFGVRTTGIFCRPSCRARKPLAKNVAFFSSVKDATYAGYRACKRCHPLDAPGTPPAWVQRLLDRIEAAPQARIKDGDLRTLGITPERARRYFQQHYGMSFHAYARGRRMSEALAQIRNGSRLDDVALGHGYESHSGFREAFERSFGIAPGQGRARDCIHVAWIESPLGPIVAAAGDAGICLLEFTDRRMLETQFKTLRKHFKRPLVPGENTHLKKLKAELRRYFDGKLDSFSVPLVYPGTEFQQKVWDTLQTIPYGKTWSYDALAKKVGSPAACRAVGTTNGLNRIAIVIPCHRVVNKSGKLGGYGGGLWRKQALLDMERGVRKLPLSR